jgi:hypothetical protein
MVSTMTFGPILPMWLAEALQPNQIGYPIMVCWFSSAVCTSLYPIMKSNLPN